MRARLFYTHAAAALLYLLLYLPASNGQNFSFHHLNTSNGLLSNMTWKIAQDSSGFIWIATNNGLQRYDGNNFVNYQHNPLDASSIPSNLIAKVLVDKFDDVWVVTSPFIILRLNHYRNKFETVVAKGADTVQSLFLSPEGELWAIGPRSLYKFNYKTQVFVRITTLPASEVFNFATLVFDSKLPVIWIGLTTGMYVYDRFEKRLEACNNSHDRFYLPVDGGIDALYSDREGTLWISTYSPGLFSFNPANSQWKIFDEKKIMSTTGTHGVPHIYFHDFIEDSAGHLWIASEKNGLLLYEKRSNTFIAYRYSSSNALSIQYGTALNSFFVSNDATIWITSDNGVNHFNPSGSLFVNYLFDKGSIKSFPVSGVNSIIRSHHGDYWLTTSSSGIFHCDSSFEILNRYSGGKNLGLQALPVAEWDQFSCSAVDKAGNIWFGGRSGYISIYQVDSKKFIVSRPEELNHSSPQSMQADEEGNVWITMRHAGYCVCWRADLKKFVRFDSLFHPDNHAYHYFDDLLVENANSIWIASEKSGLLHLFPNEKRLENFTPYDPTTDIAGADSVVTSINHFNDTTLAIGTVSNGVYLFDERRKTFKRLVPSNGLFDAYIVAISEPVNGALWVASTSGLSKYDFFSNEIIRYTETDGISNNSYNYRFYQDKNQLLIGNSFGFMRIDLRRLYESNIYQPVKITELSVMNEEVNIDSLIENKIPLRLAYNQNYFSISFARPSHFEEPSFNYAYRLLGAGQNWQTSAPGNSTVTYSALRSGKYRFEVKVQGNSNDSPITAFDVTILPPFYLQWWFMGLCALTVAAIITVFIRQRQQSKQRTEIIRRKISADLHDDIGSTLNSISIYSEIAKRRIPNHDATVLSVIEKMGIASRNMIDNMNDIVWAVNPKNDQFENVLQRMKFFAGELLSSKNILLQFDTDDHLRKIKLSMESRKNFYLIFKEAINNSCKYADCKQVSISITVQTKSLLMIITDDGRGFEEVKGGVGGNGIRNMKERAEEIGAKLDIQSWVGKGTRIALELKLN